MTGIDLLPPEISENYRIAKTRVPHLVEKETNPVKFLIREKWDPWASAQRICQHWSYRREIFGDDRWLLPLDDLSGKGALRDEEIRVLRCGAIALATDEISGQQTQIFDSGRMEGEMPEYATRTRCAMFLLALFSNDVSRKKGHDILVCISSVGVRPNPANGRMLRDGIPSSMCRIRQVCMVNDPRDGRKFLVRLAGNIVSQAVKRWHGGSWHFFPEETPEALMSGMKQVGMEASCIPEEYGGTWSYQHFCSTIEARIHRDKGAEKVGRDPQKVTSGKLSSAVASLSGYAGPSALPSSTGPRKRVASLSDSGTAPTALEAYGTNLVLQTRIELDQSSKKPERDRSFYLKRNAEYSRRNYNRRKKRDDALQAEYEELLQESDGLQAEQVRLECLLEEAQAILDRRFGS